MLTLHLQVKWDNEQEVTLSELVDRYSAVPGAGKWTTITKQLIACAAWAAVCTVPLRGVALGPSHAAQMPTARC